MSPATEIKERLQPIPEVHVGYSLYIPPHLTGDSYDHDRLWLSLFSQTIGVASSSTPSHFEVQYEQPYATRYWENLTSPLRVLKGKATTIGLHSPSQNPWMHDLGSFNEDARANAVRETVSALRFAQESDCNDYVLHLTPFDNFEGTTARNNQRMNAMQSLREIAEWVDGDPGVRILIENLEYPKWPATTDETVQLMTQIREEGLFADVGVCLDFAHLWHNIVSLSPGIPDRTQFRADAMEFVTRVSEVAPINRIHLAGAFINYNGDDHQTHALPGRNPLRSDDDRTYFSQPPEGFSGLWMPVDDALRAICAIQNPQNDVSLVIEAHSPDVTHLQTSADRIRKRLQEISQE